MGSSQTDGGAGGVAREVRVDVCKSDVGNATSSLENENTVFKYSENVSQD